MNSKLPMQLPLQFDTAFIISMKQFLGWWGKIRNRTKLQLKMVILLLGFCSPDFLGMIMKLLQRGWPFWSTDAGNRSLDDKVHGFLFFYAINWLTVAQYIIDLAWCSLQPASSYVNSSKVHHVAAIMVLSSSGAERNVSVVAMWLLHLGWFPFDVLLLLKRHEGITESLYSASLLASSIWFIFVSVLLANGVGVSCLLEISTSDMATSQLLLPVALPIAAGILFNLWTFCKVCQKSVRSFITLKATTCISYQPMAEQHHSKWLLRVLSFSLIIFTASVAVNFLSTFLDPLDPNSKLAEFTHDTSSSEQEVKDSIGVYIPGAGFSGFFYTLGRLQAFHSNSKYSHHEYYCFSAGCLALITSLMKVEIDHVIDLAHTTRSRWVIGEISRYDVVGHFVDSLLSEAKNVNTTCAVGRFNGSLSEGGRASKSDKYRTNQTGDEMDSAQLALQREYHNLQEFLPRINVITSTWNHKEHFLSRNIQRPLDIDHLRRLLVQTTWIPFVTGSSFGYMDDNGLHHNDGAFASWLKNFIHQSKKKPRFQFSLLLPLSYALLSNSLNMNLSHERAVQFWEEGRRHGVHQY